MKLNRKILAIAALTIIAGRANAESIEDPVSKSIGGELTLNCHGAFEPSIASIDGDALKLRPEYTQLSTDADSEPGAVYSGEDRFSIDATCQVMLDVDCGAPYKDAGGECRFIHENSWAAASFAAVPADEKIEAGQGIRIVRDAGGLNSEVGPNDLAMDVSPASGVVEEDFRVTYEATLGSDYSDNEEGQYHLDATLTMTEAD